MNEVTGAVFALAAGIAFTVFLTSARAASIRGGVHHWFLGALYFAIGFLAAIRAVQWIVWGAP